jgi:hypothetical protein
LKGRLPSIEELEASLQEIDMTSTVSSHEITLGEKTTLLCWRKEMKTEGSFNKCIAIYIEPGTKYDRLTDLRGITGLLRPLLSIPDGSTLLLGLTIQANHPFLKSSPFVH